MLIGGFQKMTVLDFPGKIACTVFTHGCNLLCPFCHNARLVIDKSDLFDENEILAYINKRKGLLDGVCVTGGEPLLQADIFEFIKKIKDMGMLVKLDTNGTFPDKLKYAIDNSLVDYVAMDIKNSPEKYAQTTGKENLELEKIKKSVEILLEGRVEYEFRTTVTKEMHKIEDFEKIGELIKGAERYYIQNFSDSGFLIGEGLSPLDSKGLKALLDTISPYVKSAEIRGS